MLLNEYEIEFMFRKIRNIRNLGNVHIRVPHIVMSRTDAQNGLDFYFKYQHEWKLGKREIVWKHESRRAECFHTISSFPISTSVDITIYQYGKNVLYLFYNIAQRNIKKEIFRRFRVDIGLYQHGS
jgi:hypothetical protein